MKSLIDTAAKRILLVTLSGEMVDALVVIGASDKDIIKAADGYDTVRIVLFDTNTLRGTDVTEQVARSFTEPYDNFAPLWIKSLPNFDDVAHEDRSNLIQMRAHRRSFAHASNFL